MKRLSDDYIDYSTFIFGDIYFLRKSAFSEYFDYSFDLLIKLIDADYDSISFRIF